MRFACCIKHPLDVTIQGQHDADTREHRRTAVRRHQDQRLNRRLPFRQRRLLLRKARYVDRRVAQRDELAAAGQRYRFVERSLPARRPPQTNAVAGPSPPLQVDSAH
jgi:hypothetical protein